MSSLTYKTNIYILVLWELKIILPNNFIRQINWLIHALVTKPVVVSNCLLYLLPDGIAAAVWLANFFHWKPTKKVNQMWGGGTCPTPEHPTHREPAATTEHPTHCESTPPRNTLLIVDLPQSGTPNSPLTCQIAEHPTHLGPASPQNTLLTEDLPHRVTPLLTLDLLRVEYPYSLNGKRS